MAGRTERVVIVGGGTAGWLVAAYLAKVRGQELDITLVESPDIKTIGVGEGTWPTMRNTLKTIGISESEFMRCCDATFKQASKFVNWKQAPGPDGDNFYYHLFDAPSLKWEFDPVPHWLAGMAGENTSYADAVSVQQKACEHHLAPKLMTTPEYEGLMNYAYHLDAGKFAELLMQHATQKLGVRHVQDNVTAVNLADNGDIQSVSLANADVPLAGDLFIDCSGFRSLLLGETLKVPFIDYKHVLLTDTAVTIQVPYADPNAPIASHTLSTAQEAGWIWDIGLTGRRGVGYVYGSSYTTDERAEQVLREYIGPAAEGLSARKIPIRVGRRAQMWKNNCLAVGLSSAFLEPLEASAIFLIEAACYMLGDFFPQDRESMDYVADKVNASFAYRWERVVDFIKLHYVLSGRDDSPFWRDNKDPATIPENLQRNLRHWQQHRPSRYEFTHAFEPFTKESYEFILLGMAGKQSAQMAGPVVPAQQQRARKQFEALQRAWPQAREALLTNRALLTKLQDYSFQPV